VLTLVTLVCAGSLVEFLDAQHVMVIQGVGGGLTVYNTPGPHWQGFGTVKKYSRVKQYSFSANKTEGSPIDESVKVRFADGGHAQVSGTLNWMMPTDESHILKIHQAYGDEVNLERTLLRPVIAKGIYLAGPLMTSKESAGERRSELLPIIEDQISNGVFATRIETRKDTDPLSGQERNSSVVLRIPDGKGGFIRQDKSPLQDFAINTFNLSLSSIDYDKAIEDQIQAQQRVQMDVQTARAEAIKAEQRALTAGKEGEAKAATAKWEQEVIKAKVEVEANQRLLVATKDNEIAEQYRQAQLKRAEADSTYRRRVMEADGALQQRLDASVKINGLYADALKNMKGNLVPTVVSGGNGNSGGNSVNDLIALLVAQTAKQVGLGKEEDHKK
jgi:regulator of protease activity HflC (stomatin/prohibitin superfamily)